MKSGRTTIKDDAIFTPPPEPPRQDLPVLEFRGNANLPIGGLLMPVDSASARHDLAGFLFRRKRLADVASLAPGPGDAEVGFRTHIHSNAAPETRAVGPGAFRKASAATAWSDNFAGARSVREGSCG
ncbi:hypothetical protein CPLU01_13433 [Colletotrichum plurivorum]|uniref:Uncharacterized protein n=1 Tax=Colletotrichum plurivorum TaxID=2175906 RepID=A0A8H6JRA3_9PEZI|nr:hypothetical protein CPLU01_13433 [Colletotrichum plurivorum]